MAFLDFKLGVRLLSRYPGLTVIGGLAMAFAIWVGAGSFELINQWINPSLPLPEGERIIGIQNWDAVSRQTNARALHDFVEWRQASGSVDDLSAFRGIARNLTDTQENTEPIKVAEISAYAAALTVLGAIIAGVLPALRVTRNVGAHLQQTSAGSGGGVKFSGVWTFVIVAQVAVTVVFPVSVLFIRRAEGPIRSLDVGFASEQYLFARLELEGDPDAGRIYRELDRRLSAEGLVAGVTFGDRLPRMFHDSRQIEALDAAAQGRVVSSASVAVDYMDVLGADMLAGRRFNATDVESGQRVVIVNKSFVDRVLNGRNAIGRNVRFTNPRGLSFEIVGVVKDLGMNYLGKDGAEGVYFVLPSQPAESVYTVVKVRGDPASFAPRLRAVANAVEPTLRLYNLQPMNEMNNGIFKILAIFITVALVVSFVALLLSLAGIYAAMSFSVSRRTREIGIRVALGAKPRSVVFAVFRRPLAQVGLGVTIGGCLVALFARTAFGELSSREIGFVIAYATLMMTVCLLACIVPTRRALSIQPTQALRADG